MNIYLGSCENMYDFEGNKVQLCMYYWKRVHLGIVKIWFGYELYNFKNLKTKNLVKDDKGKIITDKHLERIEIKWGWK